MLKNRIYTMAAFGLIFSSLFSCKKDLIKNSSNSNAVTSVNIEEPTILGEKKANPFTIKNMKKAYEALSNEKADGDVLVPNKLYVRFLPKNIDEAVILENQNLILEEIPLDQDVIQYGDGYQDPTLTETTWLYTTVEPDYSFGEIEYEILDSLYLPSEEEGKSNTIFKEFSKEDLENKALELAGYKSEASSVNEKVEKFNPEGDVKVQQKINSTYTSVPVKNLKVRSRWWFDYGTAYTDGNGHFYITEQYRKNRNVNIIFIFENDNVRIRSSKGVNFLTLFYTERKNIGEFENSALENISHLFTDNTSSLTSEEKSLWICAHGINAVYEQRSYCINSLINPPPTTLNMWISVENTNGNSLTKYAGAPMFHKMANNSLLYQYTSIYLMASGHPIIGLLMSVLQHYLPDITYNYSSNSLYYEFSDDITQIFYHELCHASHFSKLNNVYWLQLSSAELINGTLNPPYGLPSDINAGRIALCESWAEFCSAEFAHMKYGGNNSFPSGYPTWKDYIEKFRPFPPFGSWRWIPDGVMHDLMDDTFEPSSTGVIDSPYGFSIKQIYDALDVDVTTMQEYENRFVSETGTWQSAQIAQLFKSYGY